MTLALANGGNGNGAGLARHQGASGAAALASLDEIWLVAERVAKSRIFPVETPEEAFALMMLCQAEGRHPMEAMRRYHVMTIGNKVQAAMRSDAMQADFQAIGGVVKPTERSATRAAAFFAHPTLHPEPVEYEYTMEDAVRAGDTAKNSQYKTRPKAMLWARLITSTLTMIAPGIKVGILSTEEAMDLDAAESPAGRHIEENLRARDAIEAADVPVMGTSFSGPDERPFHQLVADGLMQANHDAERAWLGSGGGDTDAPKPAEKVDLYKSLAHEAIQLGLADGPLPASSKPTLELLNRVYRTDRAWLRTTLQAHLEGVVERSREAARERGEAIQAEAAQAAAEGPAAELFPDEPGGERVRHRPTTRSDRYAANDLL